MGSQIQINGCTEQDKSDCKRMYTLCTNGCVNSVQQPMSVSLNPKCPSLPKKTIVYSVTQTRDCAFPTSTIPCKPATTQYIENEHTTTEVNTLTTTVWNDCQLSTTFLTTIDTYIETTTVTTMLTPNPCKTTVTNYTSCKTTVTNYIDSNTDTASPTCTSVQSTTSDVTTEKVGAACSQSISSVLGTLVGILIVILVLVTISWVWTCWTKIRRYQS